MAESASPTWEAELGLWGLAALVLPHPEQACKALPWCQGQTWWDRGYPEPRAQPSVESTPCPRPLQFGFTVGGAVAAAMTAGPAQRSSGLFLVQELNSSLELLNGNQGRPSTEIKLTTQYTNAGAHNCFKGILVSNDSLQDVWLLFHIFQNLLYCHAWKKGVVCLEPNGKAQTGRANHTQLHALLRTCVS